MIYFIGSPYRSHATAGRNTRAVKIGYSESFEGLNLRLSHLQTGNPSTLWLLAVCPGTPADEKAWHKKWAKLHIRGEWFQWSDALQHAIDVAQDKADWHQDRAPIYAAEEYCRNGHFRSPENTTTGSDGRRVCRICVRESAHKSVASRAEKKAYS